MFKYKLFVNPPYASKSLRVHLRHHLDKKTIDGVTYSMDIWRGYSVDGNTIQINLESENDLSLTNYKLDAINDFFTEEMEISPQAQYTTKHLKVAITLIEEV